MQTEGTKFGILQSMNRIKTQTGDYTLLYYYDDVSIVQEVVVKSCKNLKINPSFFSRFLSVFEVKNVNIEKTNTKQVERVI